MLFVPDAGAVRMLRAIVSQEPLILKLFTNNIVPARNHTASDYEEASKFGYGAVALPAMRWEFVGGVQTYAIHPDVVFTFTGPLGRVYGYFIVQALGDILWVERFTDGPYDVVNKGDKIKVVPRFQLA